MGNMTILGEDDLIGAKKLRVLAKISAKANPTEMAIMFGAHGDGYWVRTKSVASGKVKICTASGGFKEDLPTRNDICVRPVLLADKHPQRHQYKTVPVTIKDNDDDDMDLVTFFSGGSRTKQDEIRVAVYGEYPTVLLDDNRTRMIVSDPKSVRTTGKKYTLAGKQYDELICGGTKFIVEKRGAPSKVETHLFEVKPLVWIIDEETDIWFCRNAVFPTNYQGIDTFLDQFEKDIHPSLALPLRKNETERQTKPAESKNGFVYDNLDNDQLLQIYIRAGIPVFLHGPSGVGKTDRVRAMDPTATKIALRPQMNPEEVDGILDRESRTGEYLPPLWFSQLTEKCTEEPFMKHVLFIDELTNVKPTVQSLVYTIVLDRAGKDGLWPLPENAVVVAAGNEKAGNLAAYPLTNALYRRFAHLYYEVNVSDWIDWALGNDTVQRQQHVESDKQDRARIHPAIIGFIAARNEGVLYQDLDEDDPQIVTDPRKWKMASDVLYETKNPKALLPAIGEDLMYDFVDFTKSIQLTVEDVLTKNYEPAQFKNYDIGKKYATIVGLMSCTKMELRTIQHFIIEHLGKEICKTFDELWAQYNKPKLTTIVVSPNGLAKEVDRGTEKIS